MKRLLIFGFIFVFIIYFLTSAGKTPYDYFTRLADAFLKGRYWLTENPSWLSELIPAGINKFYVVYPPMPAILLMPLVLVFGKNFPQQYLAHLLGAGIVTLTMLISWNIKKDKQSLTSSAGKKMAVWSGLLVGLGSIVWFLSSVGSSWYLGQITAAFFLTAALVESLGKKRPTLIGIFLGAAFLSRLHTILSLPLFLFLLGKKKWFKNYLYVGLGILPFVLFNFYYNFLRFGVIWDQAYFLLPKILNETTAPWFTKGVANFAYIPNNLKTAFWSFPILLNHFPYIQPSWGGLAIWITTPAFIYSLLSPWKERLTKMLWFVVLLIFLLVASHGGTGFAQFGYRFAVDFYPFLILLTIKGVARTGVKWHHWLLLIIGIVVNLWGVIWINKFGWVSY